VVVGVDGAGEEYGRCVGVVGVASPMVLQLGGLEEEVQSVEAKTRVVVMVVGRGVGRRGEAAALRWTLRTPASSCGRWGWLRVLWVGEKKRAGVGVFIVARLGQGAKSG
jgi:hypothetical protein